ncbi:MAG: hypothetical protein K9J12_15820 [Melioribacteraceae bacterium]|nr:hypothetical protein [Melioribacteraceae bacterium]MCF8263689.1 hypothetical protein [Melioribacteraceae bacterium]MCF8431064.1 hypothetical protein [Melioribacteraceae bacterium]
MESIPRNVILDLLPAYIEGEASEESKSLVEKFAENDPEIAALIKTGKLETDLFPKNNSVPEDLELKTIKKIRSSIRLKIWYVAFVTAAILMAPLIAMQFTNEVNWSVFDFIVMGILLFGTGITYVLISQISDRTAYRFAVGIAVVSGFLLIWINLAVGIIGSEDNPANLLYLGVISTGIIGAVIANLKPLGMARTMFTTAVVQISVPFIALIFWSSTLEASPGFAGILFLNAFFSVLFVISALLFRNASISKPRN